MSIDWDQFRFGMPITARFAYFDHAAVAPLPATTRAAILQWLDEAAELGDTVWPRWAACVESVRSRAAQIVGADPHEIALVANTSTGIGLIAEGFAWRAGDNVVVPENEFPSNLYPWINLERRGVECRRVAMDGPVVPLDQLFAACDARTRMISISWVGFASGWRINVRELVDEAHRRGILVFLDAIQGLGVFPLNVRTAGVDFLAADGHKWMLGPEGAGMLYVAADHLPRLRPLNVGWNSVVHSYNYSRVAADWKATAARYEGGSHNMAGMIGFGASLQYLVDAGLGPDDSAIERRVREICTLACQRLESLGATLYSQRPDGHDSGIIAFTLPGSDPVQVRQRCLDRDVVISCRDGRLRISPHAYVNESDIDQLVDALGES